nr:hypothetical protein [Tanacetum cinerariifolium]
MGMWYPKDIIFELKAFVDADHVGCQDSRKSTLGSAQFLGEKLVGLSAGNPRNRSVLQFQLQKQTIAISCNPVQHSRTKHIAVRYHFIKEHIEEGTIELYFVKTDYQLVDIFTKALPTDRFNYLVRRLGMRNLSPQELERLAKSQAGRIYPGTLPLDRVEVLGDCDVEKNGKWSCIYAVGSQEYQMVCTRLDIASADVGDENHIRTLGDYSKPSHERYKNTIELPVGNNVVPLRSDTIRLVQTNMEGCLHQKLSYTTLIHPRGVLYEGIDNHKMLMRADETHKFSDGMLNKVYNKLDVMLR